jgi:cobalamin biosynthesis Mg chelatase CobN
MNLPKFSRLLIISMLIMTLLPLTGCLYPDDQTTSSQSSARESVLTVQDAVDRYKEQTGLLPIQNAKETVPLYEKYRVDFGKLKRMDFIAQIPTASYENGGSYQFLIIDEETKPLVKLLDLTVFQAVADVQKRVDEYRSNHSNQNPAGNEMYPGFAIVDFNKLGNKAPDIISVYSRQSLNLLVNAQGQVLVDYGIDIATAIKKFGIQPHEEEDLRRVLIEASYFVPVRSPVYHLVDGEPQAIVNE